MLAKTVQTFLKDAETCAYEFLDNRSPIGRALLAYPVVALEVGANTLGSRLSAIEAAAFTAFNLVGAPFSSKYTVKDALNNAKKTLLFSAQTPILITMAPYKVFCQTLSVMFSGTDRLRFIDSVEIFPHVEKAPDRTHTWSKKKQKELYRIHPHGWNAIPVAAQDVGLNVLRPILRMIEFAAFSAINLVGLFFRKDCTLKGAVLSAQWVLLSLSQIPVELMMAIPQFLYQTGAIWMQKPLEIPLPVNEPSDTDPEIYFNS